MNNTGTNVERVYRARNPEGHWFDKSTMRFFRCRIGREAALPDGRWLFVSSEHPITGDRRYTVRILGTDGEVSEWGDGFMAYTRSSVRSAFKRAYEQLATNTGEPKI